MQEAIGHVLSIMAEADQLEQRHLVAWRQGVSRPDNGGAGQAGGLPVNLPAKARDIIDVLGLV